MSIKKEQIIHALTHVIHPEFKKDLVTLDMIQDLIVQEKYISFTLELPEKNDSLVHQLKEECEQAIHKFVDGEAVVDITAGINISKKRDLKNDGSNPQKQEKAEPALSGVKNIIAV